MNRHRVRHPVTSHQRRQAGVVCLLALTDIHAMSCIYMPKGTARKAFPWRQNGKAPNRFISVRGQCQYIPHLLVTLRSHFRILDGRKIITSLAKHGQNTEEKQSERQVGILVTEGTEDVRTLCSQQPKNTVRIPLHAANFCHSTWLKTSECRRVSVHEGAVMWNKSGG